MDTRLQELITEVDDTIEALEQEADSQREAIDRVAGTHRHGARNLLHYAALRQRDMRPLQAGLASLGATRLTTTEPSVLARLQAARNVLSAYAGEDLKYEAVELNDAFARADDVLEDHATTLFGESSDETHSRIMVTLPTGAADDPDLVRDFVDAGMELARINCAHDDEDTWARMIANVRAAAEEQGRDVRVSMDLAGPKLRTGAIVPGPAVGRARVTRTKAGQVLTPSKLWLTPTGEEPSPVPENLPGRPALPLQVDAEWLADLAVDSVISLIDNRDSKRVFTVSRVDTGDQLAVLAEGRRNAYISNSTLLEHDWRRTRVSGVPPTEQKLLLHTGDRLILTDEQVPAELHPDTTPRISCTLPEAVAAVEVGQRVLFDDGAIAAEAVDKRTTDAGHTEIDLDITFAGPDGTKLAAHKGINLPETHLPLPSLTDEDLAALRFVARHADIVNVSFIRDADDVDFVLEKLEQIAAEVEDSDGAEAGERVRNLGVVLKIETIPAYENLAAVLLAGMRHANLGIMIARGDLAVELGFARMAEVPRLIAQMAEAGHIPTILATQVLENLAKSGLPSRAEITDAAYALRAECVMLNKGPHITDAINILHRMSTRLGRSQRKNRQLLRRIGSWDREE
ncbi:pyruvate kinase [Corynebacterium halotolerans]|uniref:pyruvate kinase n=1 Tax=Corynebacterium halotolerans YIM 70093 = DSM 44683 TaxID=1121362 RepID=M1NVZ5_9CORY|nr:pyruvate kinase [Corynebacterium halotolerans]AGF73647.1 pyruvate kinase [Corynebacterium halotolerans YIM 70093 = DSM 44683]